MQTDTVKLLLRCVFCTSFILALGGCSSDKPVLKQDGPISTATYVATIDGEPAFTLGELFTEMQAMTAPGVNKASSPENAYDELLYRKLAMLNTDSYKDYDPKEVHRLAKNRLHDVLMQYLYADLISSKVVVAESSVDSFYKANIANYTIPARRRVTHILLSDNPKAWEAAGENVAGLSTEQLRTKAKEAAQQYYAEIQSGTDIAEIAAQHSHDTNSKVKRGDSGWFTREEMVEPFADAAFSLAAGKTSKPFSSIYGWHILRVDSISQQMIQPLDAELRARILAELKSKQETAIGQSFVDSVFRLAKFEWNEPLLQKNVGDYDPYDWVCIVNGTDSIDAINLRENELMYRTRMRISEVPVETRKEIILTRATPWVLFSVARQLGFTERDTIKTAYQTFRRNEIVNRIYRDRVPGDLNWTDEQLESYYNSHEGDFKSDKPVKVQHIVFDDSLKAVEALREIRGGADFKETAMKYYPGESDFKEAAFDLGWISRNDIDPDFYDRAWVTPVGEVSGPQRTKWGFHLIKVLDRKLQLDFQSAKLEVRRLLRENAYKEREAKWIADLKKGHDIVRLDDIWSQIDFANPARYQAVADSIKQAQAPGVGSGQ